MSIAFIIATILVLAVIFVLSVIFIRTALFGKTQPAVEPCTPIEVDAQRVAGKLSEGIRCKTVSNTDPAKVDRHAFLQLRVVLEKSFPYVHRFLERYETGTDSLVFIWKGRNEDLKPAVLMGHQDVVPVDNATLQNWKHEPFGGDVADGFVWGRGTLDCKSKIFGILEAVEALVIQGFKPERTTMLVFGHDEEVSSMQGVKRIAEQWKEEGIELEAVLDEGGFIQKGVFPGTKVPIALVATAEKGYLTLQLHAEDSGGHSAIPPRQTTIGILAQAIDRLEKHPFPARLDSSRRMMQGIGSALPVVYQIAFANLWLFRGMIDKIMSRDQRMSALIRTTTAPTMISGGIKENILPQQSNAIINLRILPGDSIASICDKVRAIIADERVQIEASSKDATEPTGESLTDSEAYLTLTRTVKQIFGNIPVAPTLALGATDAKYFVPLCRNVFRFSPSILTPDDANLEHGVNERVSVEALGKMVQFYAALIQAWAG